MKPLPTYTNNKCKHHHSDRDIVAIKFYCCNRYYPCFECHQESASHPAKVWPIDQFDKQAIQCGHCNTELTIHEYQQCNSRCPHCDASFNPNCQQHWQLYFTEEKS